MANFFSRYRRINFEKNDLVICRINLITKYEILEYGNSHTSWDYHDKTTWVVLPKIRILIRGGYYYYEPDEFYDYFGRTLYQGNHNLLRKGDKFVNEVSPKAIQYIRGITLTEKEQRTKKITIKRIKELENFLNSI